MARTFFYVDGFNLYHAINKLGDNRLKWLCLSTLARSFLEKQDTLESVVYFTAVMVWNKDKAQRHREYINALRATGVDVIESKFQTRTKFCNKYSRYCNFKEEKQTDVALALRVAFDVRALSAERVILVTADSDQVPLIDAIRDIDPTCRITIAAPPGRRRNARQLCDLADDHREISAGTLGTCLLPRNVSDDAGKKVAICPASYVA